MLLGVGKVRRANSSIIMCLHTDYDDGYARCRIRTFFQRNFRTGNDITRNGFKQIPRDSEVYFVCLFVFLNVIHCTTVYYHILLSVRADSKKFKNRVAGDGPYTT